MNGSTLLRSKTSPVFSCFFNFTTRTHWLTPWLTSLPSSKVWILSQLEHCTIIVGCFVLLGLAPCKEEVFLYGPLQAGSNSTLKPIHSIVKMHNLIALKSISTVWYKAQFEPLLIFFSFIRTAKCMQIFITHLKLVKSYWWTDVLRGAAVVCNMTCEVQPSQEVTRNLLIVMYFFEVCYLLLLESTPYGQSTRLTTNMKLPAHRFWADVNPRKSLELQLQSVTLMYCAHTAAMVHWTLWNSLRKGQNFQRLAYWNGKVPLKYHTGIQWAF